MTHFIGGRQNGQKKIKRERKRKEGTSPGQDGNKKMKNWDQNMIFKASVTLTNNFWN